MSGATFARIAADNFKLRVALSAALTELHQTQAASIRQHSGSISRDLAALRVRINERRAKYDLEPSGVKPLYPEEEDPS